MVNHVPCNNKSARKHTLETNRDVYNFSMNTIGITVYVKLKTV